MKLYTLSRTVDGELKKPTVGLEIEPLKAMMEAEHKDVLKRAGHLAKDIKFLPDGELIAYYGGTRHVWKIDEHDI